MIPLALIGEDLGDKARRALDPRPTGCAGHRLRLMLALTETEYLRQFPHRNNVFDHELHSYAIMWLEVIAMTHNVRGAVLLGERVADFFGVSMWNARRVELHAPVVVFAIPHPSGLNRVYNDERTRDRASRALQSFRRRAAALAQAKP